MVDDVVLLDVVLDVDEEVVLEVVELVVLEVVELVVLDVDVVPGIVVELVVAGTVVLEVELVVSGIVVLVVEVVVVPAIVVVVITVELVVYGIVVIGMYSGEYHTVSCMTAIVLFNTAVRSKVTDMVSFTGFFPVKQSIPFNITVVPLEYVMLKYRSYLPRPSRLLLHS